MTEISKNNKEIGKTIATKVPINIHNQLINLIENGDYLSISDFLREAIREQLKTYKVANFREVNYFDAKKEVISYFIKYNDCFLDEIAIDLELDFELVFNILNDLVLEGRIVKITNDELFEKRGQGVIPAWAVKAAKDIAHADRIIIAAPFWDMSFPAVLKCFFEQTSLFD